VGVGAPLGSVFDMFMKISVMVIPSIENAARKK
jgi:hypothetical protein